jgi:hypothetical protein
MRKTRRNGQDANQMARTAPTSTDALERDGSSRRPRNLLSSIRIARNEKRDPLFPPKVDPAC